MKSLNLQKSFNIILSPEFYWVKKKKLPVKFAFQAKKYAKALFEGFLPNDEYNYIVSKENEEFIFIAFSEKQIVNFMKTINIKAEQIGKIYFAQFENKFFKTPIYLDEENALIEIDKIATILKVGFISDKITLYPANENYKPTGLSTRISSKSFFTQMQIYILSGLILFFALLNFVEAWGYGIQTEIKEIEFEEFVKKTGLPNSTYQLKNIYQKYDTLDKTERNKRDVSLIIIKSIMKHKGEITMFNLEKKKLLLMIKVNPKTKNGVKIKSQLSKEKFIKKMTVNKDIMVIRANI